MCFYPIPSYVLDTIHFTSYADFFLKEAIISKTFLQLHLRPDCDPLGGLFHWLQSHPVLLLTATETPDNDDRSFIKSIYSN